jgi:hypothetical protein
VPQLTRFAAYAAADGPRHCHAAPHAKSFEEAALEFTEVWHPSADAEGEVQVIVLDRETGREQCFIVDVGAGDAAPC